MTPEMSGATAGRWPEPPEDWEETRATFHLWTQVIGKIRLACTPTLNHWWNTPLYVTASGLTTSLIPYGPGVGFQIDLDLIDHQLLISTTRSTRRSRDLRPESVAAFHAAVMALLAELDISVTIWPMPVEIPGAIPFDQDTVHASYDKVQIERYWRTLLESHRVFELFRSRYLGKTSPVHLFWGALDLATSRFSGRIAPLYTGSAANCDLRVMREAYSREVSSAGFWPSQSGECQYYSYIYPEPPGFRDSVLLPPAARYDDSLGEFILDYRSVCNSDNPDRTLLQFLQSSYSAAAEHAGWDRAMLERDHDYDEL